MRQMKGHYKVKSPGLKALVGGGAEAGRASLRVSRCGIRCAAGIKRRIGWRTRRWIKDSEQGFKGTREQGSYKKP